MAKKIILLLISLFSLNLVAQDRVNAKTQKSALLGHDLALIKRAYAISFKEQQEQDLQIRQLLDKRNSCDVAEIAKRILRSY